MKEAVLFETPLQELDKMSYADLSLKFGAKKKMLQSFDLTVDQPILGIRLYSFGRQTGYTHPPKTVLPIYTKSDTWGYPVKEYVVMEEYVTDPQGTEHFTDCVFLQVDSDNLMNVTQENYAYDNIPTSLLKISPDQSYKAWYNQAPAFDYKDNLFVIWKRLIVYPKSTQNKYFNRYDVIHTYPANKVKSFDILKFFVGKTVSFKPVEGEMPNVFYGILDEKTKEVIKAQPPVALLPVMLYGINSFYPKATYYQAIEAQFPDFGLLLSMRGALKYNTFLKFFTEPDLTKNARELFRKIFNSHEIDTYYFDQNKKPNPEFDALIPLLQNADQTMEKLLAGETLASLTAHPAELKKEEVIEQDLENTQQPLSRKLLIGMVIIGVLMIGGVIFVLSRRKIHTNINEL